MIGDGFLDVVYYIGCWLRSTTRPPQVKFLRNTAISYVPFMNRLSLLLAYSFLTFCLSRIISGVYRKSNAGCDSDGASSDAGVSGIIIVGNDDL